MNRVVKLILVAIATLSLSAGVQAQHFDAYGDVQVAQLRQDLAGHGDVGYELRPGGTPESVGELLPCPEALIELRGHRRGVRIRPPARRGHQKNQNR